MARPTKQGIDYFPFNCHMSDKIESVESVHGNDGFAVIVKAWQVLYQTDDGMLDCSGVLRRKTLAKRANISEELWIKIIETCIDAGLFDRELWESGMILRSNGVAKRMEKILDERRKGRERAATRWNKDSLPNNDTDNDRINDTKGKGKGKGKGKEVNTPLPPEGGTLSGKQAIINHLAGDILNPGFSDDFMTRVWPAFVRNKKGKYKNLETQSIAIKQLFDKSGGDEATAVQALRETLANSYQGFTWYFDQHNGTGKRETGMPDLAAMTDEEFWPFYHPYKTELNCSSLSGLIPTREDAERNLTNYLKQKIAKYGRL